MRALRYFRARQTGKEECVKRAAKKLTLFKETLRRLESGHLKNVVGATGVSAMCPTFNDLTCTCETDTACQISACICQ